MGNLEQYIKIAIEASIEAGKEIMKIYNQDFTVEVKSDESPLTLADKNANTVINNFLKETDVPVISEENIQIEYDERKWWDMCWIIDPLDGTKEFIKRNGEFTVNIALIEKGLPVLGVIYVPVSKQLFWANVSEEKAYKHTLEFENFNVEEIINSSIVIKRENSSSSVIKVVGSRSHMNEETKSYIENLKKENKEVEILSKGSSLKFCLVVEGKADVYPRFAPTMEWDTAAAHAICKAAGVSVLHADRSIELVYNKEDLLNPWFLCTRIRL